MMTIDRRGFVERHWEKKATMLSAAETGWRAPTEVVFETMRVAAARFRAGEEAPWRVFLGDVLQDDPEQFLPRASDASFASYAARVDALCTGSDFTIIASAAHMHHFPLWSCLRDLLAPIFQLTGVPPYFVEASIVFGRYPATVFGLHQDLGTLLMHVVLGEKTLHVWPEAALDDDGVARVQKDELARRALYADALTLAGRPGDLQYCPAGDWHIAESPAPSLTLNIQLGTRGGNYYDPSPGGRVAEIVSSVVGEALSENGFDAAVPLRTPTGARGALATAELRRAARWLESARGANEVRERLEQHVLAKSTGIGCNYLPPLAEPPRLRASTWLACDARFPVACTRGAAGRWLIAANGRVVALEGSRFAASMLAKLRCGRPRRVGELLALATTAAEARVARELLRELCSWRALEVVAAPGAKRERATRDATRTPAAAHAPVEVAR